LQKTIFMKNNIKLFITDINGVWTNNRVYYDKNGNETKCFNLNDGVGVMFLYLNNIPLVVITEDQNEIIKLRLKKLKITDYHLGVTNKTKTAEEILKKYNVKWDEIAYIGDDINDLPLLKKAGYAAVPGQAPYYVKKEVPHILTRHGGGGVFREFVEKYLDEIGLLNKTIEKYLTVYESLN